MSFNGAYVESNVVSAKLKGQQMPFRAFSAIVYSYQIKCIYSNDI